MSNRPVKKNKQVVEITQEDFDVEWTPPPRTARDRMIQIGVVFLIFCFLLPAVTCVASPTPPPEQQAQQQMPDNPIDMAIKQNSEAVGKNPRDTAALANLGMAQYQKALLVPPVGEKKEEHMTLLLNAEKNLRAALDQDPDYELASDELARTLLLMDKREEADKLIKASMESVEPKLTSEDDTERNSAKSRKVKLLTMLAQSEAQAGRMDEAIAKVNEAIEIQSGRYELYLVRAEMHMGKGDKDAARKDLEKVVEIAQKMGDQQLAAHGQKMIEMLDNPPKMEVISVEEEDLEPSPSPSPE